MWLHIYPPLFYCAYQNFQKCHSCDLIEVPHSEIFPLKKKICELSGMDMCIKKSHNFL